MEALLDFARGPLFRFSLAVMGLGLLRVIFLDVTGFAGAYRRAGDKTMPWNYIVRRTFRWLFPVNSLFINRPVYSSLSILFHVGLLGVPIFLYAHVMLWNEAIGLSWWTLPKALADYATLATILFGLALLVSRISSAAARFLSRKQDYLWLVILIIPFITGYACANLGPGPAVYQVSMLIHVLAGDLMLILIPFTKIAHCVLMPFSQAISGVAWRFPAETDEVVSSTLDKKGAPV